MGKRSALSVLVVMTMASTFLVVGALPALAAVSFDPQVPYAVGAGPGAVATGDFDGDGITDLATTNGTSNNVSILLGNADGTFGASSNFTVDDGLAGAELSPQSIATGDFDGDGVTDLVTANGGSNTLSVLLGAGDGTFGVTSVLQSGGFTTVFVATGYFDAGSDIDLAVANDFSGVSVMLGDGAGSFGLPTPFPAGVNPGSIATGDFDGDTETDLAVTNVGSDNVSIMLGDGAGSFGAPDNFTVGSLPVSIATGYFNAGTDLDLAVANAGTDNVSILLGDGDGTFDPATNFATGDAPRSVEVADIDGDGVVDLAVRNTGAPNNVVVLLGDGAGSFLLTGGPIGVGSGLGRLTTEDFNGDSMIDLAVANANTNNVSILLNAAPSAPIPTASSPASPADDNTPLIIGTAPAGSFVILYTDAACSGPSVAVGTAADFAAPGIAVSVADNTTTTFYAIANDGTDDSPCSAASVTYEEVTAPPPPPPTPSPTPTPTVEPPPSPGVHISVSNLTPKRGNTFVVTTWLDECLGNEFTDIELQRRKGTEWIEDGTIPLDGDCRAQWEQEADFTSRAFRTFWSQQNENHSSGYSGVRTVTPKDSLPGPRVRMVANDTTPASGDAVVFKTRIRRCAGLAGDKLQLFRLAPGLTKEDARGDENLTVMSDGVYRKIATHRVDENCRTDFEVKANFETATFKSIWPKQDPRYRRGHSKASVIVTR